MNHVPQKWVIGEDPQHPAIAISEIATSDMPQFAVMEEGDVSGISRLNPLLQAIPAALTSQHVSQHHFMEVIIDGPLAKAKDGVGFRAFSLGDNGKIKEHAVLMDPEKLGNLVNTGLLLQTASVLLAQKHLADINEKLLTISEDVKKVANFQTDERASKIYAAIKYLRQTAPGLQNGELSSAIRKTLEDLELELIGIQTHLLKEIVTISHEVQNCAISTFFSSDKITTKLKGLQQDQQKRIVEWKMALSARAFALQMVSLFSGDETLLKARESSIRQDVDEFKKVLEEVAHVHRNRIDAISPVTESSNATHANKVMLNKWLSLHLAPQKQQTEAIRLGLEQFSQRLAIEQAQPTRLIVEMADGKPVKLFHAA